MKQYNYHIITFGCQMNKSDSERIETVLQNMGLEAVNNSEKADVVIINTCSVRQSAEDRVFGLNRNFLKLKKVGAKPIVVVTGCMAGRDKDEKIRKKLQGVDLFFPTEELVKLPYLLREINPDLPALDLGSDYLRIRPNYKDSHKAFVTIQTGCNQFCTYCVVPFARGTEGNRSLKQILEEVSGLAETGCLEITLLGQIVNHYKAPDPEYFSKKNPYKKNDFAKLLWEINKMTGIERIHWTAPHPLYMDDEVIDALALDKQINYLHLPVQSGNDEILKKMNRKHDRDYFIDRIKKIKLKKPGISIGTDLIVGFCGENDKQFADTVSLYKTCNFDISYNAQYSVRSGTGAAKLFRDDVPKEIKKKRWHKLQALMEDIVYKKNQKFIGKTVQVLVDNYKNGVCSGYSENMKLVQFPGTEKMIASIQPAKIKKAKEWVLYADPIK
ncbi:MAG: tRNA (N6-isopentenyl adenosine(37)-C2)-methylthiotransferase MiaB [Candidatus Magasanikbacteria bacterium]|nr:tRNA (N6-isopentenyl adenosine(37)-C2)-methylthiotransferase MiaB [Candidatus Magasanikbacteria bacterium]